MLSRWMIHSGDQSILACGSFSRVQRGRLFVMPDIKNRRNKQIVQPPFQRNTMHRALALKPLLHNTFERFGMLLSGRAISARDLTSIRLSSALVVTTWNVKTAAGLVKFRC